MIDGLAVVLWSQKNPNQDKTTRGLSDEEKHWCVDHNPFSFPAGRGKTQLWRGKAIAL